MKLPSRVRITRKVEYEVVYIDDFKDESQVGEARHYKENKQIVIQNGLSKTETIKTFLHEVIHAIDAENDVGLTEKQVLKLEEGVYRTLKLNGVL